MKSPITTHVLDTQFGQAAVNVPVSLWKQEEVNQQKQWTLMADGVTDADGRNGALLAGKKLQAGVYQMRFDTQAYHESQNVEGFYPEAQISFYVKNPDQHYHIPLLISPFAYSTYRGT